MIDKELIAILACPDTHQPLAAADDALLERLNAAISAGAQKNVGGEAVTEAIHGALVREDGKIAYPVRDDIPLLLIEEGLPVGEG